MRICQIADSHMMDGGRIVLVGSPVAFAGANKPLCRIESTLRGLTMSVSRQLGKRGICVNTVLPGPMITGMTNDWSEENARIAEETRLNRLAKPEDIAHVMVQMMGENGHICPHPLSISGHVWVNVRTLGRDLFGSYRQNDHEVKRLNADIVEKRILW